MRVTIVRADGAVYKNNVAYFGLDLSSIPDGVTALQFDTNTNTGHIEYTPPIPNENLTVLPNWVNECIAVWEIADNANKTPPNPTPEELIQKCKQTAKEYLLQTDWVELASVTDPLNTPHLLNIQEFINYRKIIRNYAVTPVTNPVWPTLPSANWSTK